MSCRVTGICSFPAREKLRLQITNLLIADCNKSTDRHGVDLGLCREFGNFGEVKGFEQIGPRDHDGIVLQKDGRVRFTNVRRKRDR